MIRCGTGSSALVRAALVGGALIHCLVAPAGRAQQPPPQPPAEPPAQISAGAGSLMDSTTPTTPIMAASESLATANMAGAPVGPAAAIAFVADGDRAHAAMQPTVALAAYERAIALDSNYYDALYKAAGEAVELGLFETNKPIMTAYFDTALAFARRAVTAYPTGSDGHYMLARVEGRAAMAVSGSNRIQVGKNVRNEALLSLKYDSLNPGGLHVLGVWNAEVMRLSGFERFIARTLLGGGILGKANWHDAQSYMEKSVAVDPNRIIHHLDLGVIYLDVGKKPLAREQFELVMAMPLREYNDPHYKAEAQRRLGEL
jgi:tetratricopeptide (TPR) repeat protein